MVPNGNFSVYQLLPEQQHTQQQMGNRASNIDRRCGDSIGNTECLIEADSAEPHGTSHYKTGNLAGLFLEVYTQYTEHTESISSSEINAAILMASSTSVPDIPASDCQLANLTVVSYDKILCKDSTEAALLFSACADQGFFYLDLGSSTNYQEIVNKLFEASKDYFSQPLEQKLKDKREDLSVFNICG